MDRARVSTIPRTHTQAIKKETISTNPLNTHHPYPVGSRRTRPRVCRCGSSRDDDGAGGCCSCCWCGCGGDEEEEDDAEEDWSVRPVPLPPPLLLPLLPQPPPPPPLASPVLPAPASPSGIVTSDARVILAAAAGPFSARAAAPVHPPTCRRRVRVDAPAAACAAGLRCVPGVVGVVVGAGDGTVST